MCCLLSLALQWSKWKHIMCYSFCLHCSFIVTQGTFCARIECIDTCSPSCPCLIGSLRTDLYSRYKQVYRHLKHDNRQQTNAISLWRVTRWTFGNHCFVLKFLLQPLTKPWNTYFCFVKLHISFLFIKTSLFWLLLDEFHVVWWLNEPL